MARERESTEMTHEKSHTFKLARRVRSENANTRDRESRYAGRITKFHDIVSLSDKKPLQRRNRIMALIKIQIKNE